MIGGIPTPQDDSLLLQDTTTKTASFNSAGFDLGAGFAPGALGMAAAAVVDVSAADRANSDETYTFKLQESSDNSTFADIGVATSITVSGATSTLGVYVAKGFISKRYVRLVLTAAGTTPSITYKAWLNTTFQR
ncbi:MAG: hypothetical protein WBD40_10810 [Tepidisphaeraceae bacterium]